MKQPILLSILAALVTLALKFSAYYVTGSVGLLSDALESLVNLFAAIVAFVSLWYAARPVDESHTYGHEKIEFFSSGVEGALIVIAAGGIGWYAIGSFFAPPALESLDLGAGLALVATAVNFVVARILLRIGRERGSIVLVADGRHLMADVWTSLAVVAGVVVVRLTAIHKLDALIALGVALHILWTGFDLVRISFDGLMDHALPPAEQNTVRAAIAAQLGPEMAFHALRTRLAGSRRFADFHLLVPGRYTVQAAHEIIARIEEAVQRALPGIEVTIHAEPIEDREAWEDSALLPIEQAARREEIEEP
jgi:cation diffusion facilitator family transporter